MNAYDGLLLPRPSNLPRTNRRRRARLPCFGCEGAQLEDWCGEYGYDSDSRKAERTYKAIHEQSEKLAGFLGSELYEMLLASGLKGAAPVTRETPGLWRPGVSHHRKASIQGPG